VGAVSRPRTTAAVALALAVAACRPAGPVAQPVQPIAATRANERPVTRAEPEPRAPELKAVQGASAGLTKTLAERREQGLAALDAGRFDLARQAFAEVLDAAPGNLATQALFDAATQAMLAAQQESAASFANRNATVVAAPPWGYTLRKKIAAPAGAAPTLKLVSEAKNAITDDAEWFQRHQVELQEYEVPNPMRGEPGNLPPSIPPTFGKFLLVQAIRQADLNILFYGPDYSGGRFVAVQRAQGGEIVALLDFDAWEFAPDAEPGERMFVDQRAIWAAVDGDVLYVSHGHHTYARSSKGKNAYVSALDLTSGELLWRSAPLVANTANFVIVGGHIVTGYGFTAEPDFLYVLERATGKTVGKTRVKSGPDYLFYRSGQLYVRCYDTDYVFELRQGGG
jgi:hypothetical protein